MNRSRIFLITLLLAHALTMPVLSQDNSAGPPSAAQEKVIVNYRGSLEDGVTYRAKVKYDQDEGVFPLIPLKIPLHQAARIEWTNLAKFPGLVRLARSSKQREIVFRVTSSKTVQMTPDRWDRTFRCSIVSVE
jgi:hypothetical protein